MKKKNFDDLTEDYQEKIKVLKKNFEFEKKKIEQKFISRIKLNEINLKEKLKLFLIEEEKKLEKYLKNFNFSQEKEKKLFNSFFEILSKKIDEKIKKN